MATFPEPRIESPLTWEIADLSQNVLARLDNRKAGASITIPQNDGRRATVTLDASDPALAASATVAGLPVLDKVLRVWIQGQGEPLFCGRIFAPAAKGKDHTVTLNALDPWARLDRDVIQEFGGPANKQILYKQYAALDQSVIAQNLVGYGSNDHGIYAPSSSLAAASVTRTLSYPVGQTLGQALRDLTNLNTGPDVELVPIINATHPTALAQLYTYYPKRGTDKSASVVFEYGHGRQSAIDYEVTPAGESACNYLMVTGAQRVGSADWRIAFVAQHAASIAQYGLLAKYEDRSETTDRTTLADYATSQVGQLHDPTAFFSFTQAPTTLPLPPEPTGDGFGTPPSFGRAADYYLGDTIALRIQPVGTDDPSLQQTFTGHVTDAQLTELANGQIQIQVDCGPEIDTSGVTGVHYNAYLPDLSTI